MSLDLLTGPFFQAGYVVRDLEKGVDFMRRTTGVQNWQLIDLRPDGLIDGMALAWTKGVMLELIAVDPDNALPVYQKHIPATTEEARFHHLGYMLETEEDYHARVRDTQAAGIPEAFSKEFWGALTYYADSYARLGHFVEFVHLKPEAEHFFAGVPHND
jgi:hypothetical protein